MKRCIGWYLICLIGFLCNSTLAEKLLSVTNKEQTLEIHSGMIVIEGNEVDGQTFFAVGPSNSMADSAIGIDLIKDEYAWLIDEYARFGDLIRFLQLGGQKRTSWLYQKYGISMKLTFSKGDLIWKMTDPEGSESITLNKKDIDTIIALLVSRAK